MPSIVVRMKPRRFVVPRHEELRNDASHETNNDRPDNTHVKSSVENVSSEDVRRACTDRRPKEALAKALPAVPPGTGRFVVPARPAHRAQWLVSAVAEEAPCSGLCLIQDSAASPWPFCLKRSSSSPSPPPSRPPTPPPASAPPRFAEQATQGTLLVAGAGLPGVAGRALQQLPEFVPVLVARQREQAQQRRHRWHPARHVRLLILNQLRAATFHSVRSSTPASDGICLIA